MHSQDLIYLLQSRLNIQEIAMPAALAAPAAAAAAPEGEAEDVVSLLLYLSSQSGIDGL